MHLYDPRVFRKNLQVSSGTEPYKSIKMKWLGNSGKIIQLSTRADQSGRFIKLYDIRSIGQGPIIHKKLDNYAYSADMHFYEDLDLLFVTNKG